MVWISIYMTYTYQWSDRSSVCIECDGINHYCTWYWWYKQLSWDEYMIALIMLMACQDTIWYK